MHNYAVNTPLKDVDESGKTLWYMTDKYLICNYDKVPLSFMRVNICLEEELL